MSRWLSKAHVIVTLILNTVVTSQLLHFNDIATSRVASTITTAWRSEVRSCLISLVFGNIQLLGHDSVCASYELDIIPKMYQIISKFAWLLMDSLFLPSHPFLSSLLLSYLTYVCRENQIVY
jgi:hypothetical protein